MPRRDSPTTAVPERNDAAPKAARQQGDHWKKLLRPPKAAVPVSVEEFVAELNRRLRADVCYREGTRFIVAGNDDSHPGGSTWEGPDAMKPVVFRIVQSTFGEYEAELPFFSDR